MFSHLITPCVFHFPFSPLILTIVLLCCCCKDLQLSCSHNDAFDVGALSHFPMCPIAAYINFISSAEEESNTLMSSLQTDFTWNETFRQ